MSEYRKNYVLFQLEKSKGSFLAAKLLLENNFLNEAVSRLYYSCFYSLNALTVKNGMKSKTHTGLKSLLYLHFVKTGIISPELGQFYAEIFNSRQKGDYADFFEIDKETVEKLMPQAQAFIEIIESLIISK